MRERFLVISPMSVWRRSVFKASNRVLEIIENEEGGLKVFNGLNMPILIPARIHFTKKELKDEESGFLCDLQPAKD
jgi:hypothetical protein